MAQIAKDVAGAAVPATARDTIHSFDLAFERGADLAWETTEQGNPVAVAANSNFKFDANPAATAALPIAELPVYFRSMPSGAELWQYRGKYFLAGRARSGSNFSAGRTHVPGDFPSRIRKLKRKRSAMTAAAANCALTNSMLLTLLLFHHPSDVLGHLVRAVSFPNRSTVPIRRWPKRSQEIIAGNFETRVTCRPRMSGDAGPLVQPNAEPWAISRRQINVFTTTCTKPSRNWNAGAH